MRWLIRFGRFWYDFIVGDDWTIALGVIAAVVLTAGAAHTGIAAWPILPLTVIVGLAWSVFRARRGQPQPAPTSDVLDG
jgi:hypothetical protein